MLATLLRPSAGTAEIAGWSVTRNPDQVRRVLGFMPDAFGVYDDMKVWEYLDFFARCYGLAAGRPAPDDRRPARPRRPRRQARRLRPDPVARACSSGCASPTRSSTTRRCCCSTSRPPASTRAPGSSCASSSASCARWARRSSSAATSSPSSRSCARASRSSTAARSWPRAASSDIERRLRFGAVLRVRAPARGRGARGGPRPVRRPIRTWPSAAILDDGTIELGFRGDDAASARLLAAVGGGRAADRQLRARRERPRGALPPGDVARSRTDRSGVRRRR